ncbi:unnamed protein product, partial [Pocillopora meandrina]
MVMVAVASLSLLLSLWQLFENKLSRNYTKIRFRTTVLRNLVQIVLVNLFFLIIRLVVYAMYQKDESIFITKNIISIVWSILDTKAHCESHSVKFWSVLCKSCFGLRKINLARIQCFLLAAYPATYENDPNWYAVTTTFFPVVCTWTYLVRFKAAKLRWLFYVWYLYVI